MADERNIDASPDGLTARPQEGRDRRPAAGTEQAAAIDPVVAGLAHEGRNALQATQACVERLRWRVQGKGELLALLAEIEKAQDALHRLFDDIRACAAPLCLDSTPCNLTAIWRAAWRQALGRHPGRDARLAEMPCADDRVCVADAARLGLVFRNVFENALARCPGPAVVTVSCSEALLAGEPAVRVAVRDNAPGPADARAGSFGMTIAKRLVEAHGGAIAAGEGGSPGAEVVITLPRSQP